MGLKLNFSPGTCASLNVPGDSFTVEFGFEFEAQEKRREDGKARKEGQNDTFKNVIASYGDLLGWVIFWQRN